MPEITRDPARGFDGRWLVAATLSLFLVVPLFVYALFGIVRPGGMAPPPEALVYAERATWPSFGLTPESLEREMMSRARTNQRYVELPFDITADEEAALSDCVVLARRPDFLDAEGLDERLEALSPRARFYADALLAIRAAHRGDASRARERWAEAFAAAPAAIRQEVKRPDGTPAPGAEVGTVALVFDRITEADTIDPSLELVYPGVSADDRGVWTLPIFKSIFRIVDPPAAPAGAGGPGMFSPEATVTFPGRVGLLDPLILLP